MEGNSENTPCQHTSCVISAFRGFRNGVYYGGRIRLVHSLIMAILFKKGSYKEILTSILEMTFEHAQNLGLFVFLYKSMVCILNILRSEGSKYHSLIAGTAVGYVVFRKKTAVNNQIILYLLARILVGAGKKLTQQEIIPKMKFYPIFASLIWGVVMFLFEDDKTNLQPSLANSMTFIYKDSDKKLKSWTELIPFEKPEILKKIM